MTAVHNTPHRLRPARDGAAFPPVIHTVAPTSPQPGASAHRASFRCRRVRARPRSSSRLGVHPSKRGVTHSVMPGAQARARQAPQDGLPEEPHEKRGPRHGKPDETPIVSSHVGAICQNRVILQPSNRLPGRRQSPSDRWPPDVIYATSMRSMKNSKPLLTA